jgi:Family of unknown function (DUF5767)
MSDGNIADFDDELIIDTLPTLSNDRDTDKSENVDFGFIDVSEFKNTRNRRTSGGSKKLPTLVKKHRQPKKSSEVRKASKIYEPSSTLYCEMVENKDKIQPSKKKSEFSLDCDITSRNIFNDNIDGSEDDDLVLADDDEANGRGVSAVCVKQENENSNIKDDQEDQDTPDDDDETLAIREPEKIPIEEPNKIIPEPIVKKATPTLSELNVKHTEKILEIDEINKTEIDESNKKRARLCDIERLKKIYGEKATKQFNDLSMLSDYNRIEVEYTSFMKQISIHRSADSYKRFLMLFIMGIEAGAKLIFGLDMTGFTKSQESQMQQYDELLLELCEESYIPKGKNEWPVLVRLIITLGMNTVLFAGTSIISRRIGNSTNESVMGIVNMISPLISAGSSNKPPVKMTGPKRNM